MSSTYTPLLYFERRAYQSLKTVRGISESSVKFSNITGIAIKVDASLPKTLIAL
jgi:hypothetical protein